MIRSLLKCRKILKQNIRSIHHNDNLVPVKSTLPEKTNITYEFLKKESIEDSIKSLCTEEPKSVLEKCEEDLSHIATYLKPSFNFAAYVNKSETLQELLKLGVNLYKLEKKPEIPQYILGLDLERY
ncbi:hypothetical protein HHI36_004200 [Cryptolaemus montrouzieri]|uniref:Uncharacterized protein n=1 Tax=Cryptolaemus montrouzieri TaxID=559131 RepID=A0ABD2NQR2_9CUCU